MLLNVDSKTQPSNCEYLKKRFYTACESSLSDPLQFRELSKQKAVARDEIVAKPSGVFFPRNCHPLDFILNQRISCCIQ